MQTYFLQELHCTRKLAIEKLSFLQRSVWRIFFGTGFVKSVYLQVKYVTDKNVSSFINKYLFYN
jgi:hypothetical protein